MKICITGTTSGIGKSLNDLLVYKNYKTIPLSRNKLDMSDIESVINYDPSHCDVLVNCAGHDYGGKCTFTDHDIEKWVEIINVNLTSTMALTQKVLRKNPNAIICNITSTNCDKYYGNDLIYTLTKNSLSNFTELLKIDFPDGKFKEFRLGLVKTNFNKNRHKFSEKKVSDDIFYSQPHLQPDFVAQEIIEFITSDSSFQRLTP